MMMNSDTATTQLRDAGLRLTPQRRAIIEALAGDTTHPLAEEIAARVASRVPGVSLSTVYKTLHEFAAIGMIRELDMPGAMRFDTNVNPHAHLLCDSCGAVIDIAVPSGVVESLSDAAGTMTVSDIEITLHGTCSACSAQ